MCAFRQTHFSPKPQQVHKRKHSLSFLSLLRGHEGYIPREVRAGYARSPDEQATFSAARQDKGIKNSCSCSPPIEELLKTNSNLQHSSPSQGWQLVDDPKVRDHQMAFLAFLLGKEQSRSCHISDTQPLLCPLLCPHKGSTYDSAPPSASSLSNHLHTLHCCNRPRSCFQLKATVFTSLGFFIYKSN